MASIFTKTIKRKIPSYTIPQTEDYYAFLDINPLAKGHTLCVPKKEVDYIYDLDDETLAGLHIFAKKVGLALEACIPCKRIGVLIIGTEVPHAHVHLIPFQQERQMAITSKKENLSREEMTAIAKEVSEKYKEMNAG